MSKLRISIAEVSFDEAEAHGHDGTLRSEEGPLVKVSLEAPDGSHHDFYGVLVEARITPEYLQEV